MDADLFRIRPPTTGVDEKLRRRRFFLSRMKRVTRDGRPIRALRDLRRSGEGQPMDMFGGVPYCIVGGQATRRYMPERTTLDLDVLVPPEQFQAATDSLKAAGWSAEAERLLFDESRLGLLGRRFLKDGPPLDLMTSDQDWARQAVETAVLDQGRRIVSLAYLVLMKLDASRGVDQGDLTRMLGLAEEPDIEAMRAAVAHYMPADSDDLEQYIQFGRYELGR
jgi:hypothetical protein